MSLSYIIDDASSLITYGGAGWTATTDPQWFFGTSHCPTIVNDSLTLGSISLTFQGTSLGLWGTTLPSTFPSMNMITVSIDGGPFQATSVPEPARETWMQWYKTPALPEGTHTVEITHLAQAVDVGVVSASQLSPLATMELLVDDADPSLVYSGSWSRNTAVINEQGGVGTLIVPIGKGTTGSAKKGDKLTFSFTGTSIKLYGVSRPSRFGYIAASYTLDNGVPMMVDHSVFVPSPGAPDVTNVLLFNATGLAATAHTLTVEITLCSAGNTFSLDYITYMPADIVESPPPTSFPPINNSPASATTVGPTESPAAGSKPSAHVALIIVGLSGALLVVILSAIILLLYIRRRRRRSSAMQRSPWTRRNIWAGVEPHEKPDESPRVAPEFNLPSAWQRHYAPHHMASGSATELLPQFRIANPGRSSTLSPVRPAIDEYKMAASEYRSSMTKMGDPSTSGSYETSTLPPPAYDDIQIKQFRFSKARR